MLVAVVAVVSACGDDGTGGTPDVGGTTDGARPRRDSGGTPADGGGSGTDSGGARTDAGPPVACEAEPEHTGQATYYDFADGSGNCMFPATPSDPWVAAMNHPDYADSTACGSCAHIVGPSGEATVRIVDRCPECPAGNIDLHPMAFAALADVALGRVAITWRYVPCDVTGPIVYHFKEGSNQWWTAVQVRNHRHAIARFEYRANDGSWREVTRLDYNFFVEAAGMGPGPYDFRVTDVRGNVLEDTGIPHVEAGDVPGAAQFPPCR